MRHLWALPLVVGVLGRAAANNHDSPCWNQDASQDGTCATCTGSTDSCGWMLDSDGNYYCNPCDDTFGGGAYTGDETKCNNHIGCDWNSTTSTCSAVTTDSCNATTTSTTTSTDCAQTCYAAEYDSCTECTGSNLDCGWYTSGVGTCAPCSAQYSQQLCDPHVGCNWNGTECNPVTTESCPELDVGYCSSAALFEATETDAKLLAVHDIAVSDGHVDAFEHGWYTDYINNGSAYTSSFRSTTPPLGFSGDYEDCLTLYQYNTSSNNYDDVTGTQFFLESGVRTCSIYGEAEISHTFSDLTPDGYYDVSVAIDELDHSNFTEDGLTYNSGSTAGFGERVAVRCTGDDNQWTGWVLADENNGENQLVTSSSSNLFPIFISIMAAVGLVQLKYLDEDNKYRNYVSNFYDSKFEDNEKFSIIQLQATSRRF